MYVSTFHSRRLTTRNWRMLALVDFMESLTQGKGKIIQMGIIIKSKDQALAAGVSNQSQSKKKDLKQREKEKKESSLESSISTDGSSKSRRRNKREITTCDYCKGSHLEKSCFKNNMNIMIKILEENHIALPEFVKRWEHKQGNGKPEHALGAWVKPHYVLFIFASHYDIL